MNEPRPGSEFREPPVIPPEGSPPPRSAAVEVIEPEVVDDQPPPGAPGRPPIHALSALLLLGVDNLWNLADWTVVSWVLTIPAAFLTVAVPTFFLQKLLQRDRTGRALGWSVLLGAIAAVPFSVSGTLVGSALLAWLGIHALTTKPRMPG